VERSETRYTRSGDVSIAYQVVGDGPFDLVYVPGWVSSIELMWDEPDYAAFLERLASFSRLIIFDKRGTGLSDPVPLDQLAHARGADGRRPGSHGTPLARSVRRCSGTEGGNMCVMSRSGP
jgi:pimeloyl-ACP methyl ester carboxylesterase